MDEIEIVSQLALAIAATVATVLSVLISRRVAEHEFRQASLLILQDLTTGEVATARDVVGTFMYGDDGAVRRLSRSDVMRSYYVLLWCVERVAAGYRALDTAGGDGTTQAFCQSVDWHANEIVTNLALVRAVLSPDDAEAWGSLVAATGILSGGRDQLRVSVPGPETTSRAITDRGLAQRAAAIS